MNNAELIAELRGHILSVPLTLLHDAADALEAADKHIEELEKQMPKEAHWVAVENGHGVCSNCNRQDSIDNMATHCRYCGARIKGENDDKADS